MTAKRPVRPRRGQETVANPAVEVKIELGLEAGHVARCLPAETDLGGQVEQDRQVGHETVRGDRGELAQPLESEPGTVALVGQASSRRSGRRGQSRPASRAGSMTSVTSCRRAALKRSASVSGSGAALVSVPGEQGHRGAARRATCRPARA